MDAQGALVRVPVTRGSSSVTGCPKAVEGVPDTFFGRLSFNISRGSIQVGSLCSTKVLPLIVRGVPLTLFCFARKRLGLCLKYADWILTHSVRIHLALG